MQYPTFKRWLDAAVDATGLNDSAFGRASGIPQSTVTQLRKGLTTPKIGAIIKILAQANRLGLQRLTLDDAIAAVLADCPKERKMLEVLEGQEYDEIKEKLPIAPEGLAEYRSILRKMLSKSWNPLWENTVDAGLAETIAACREVAYGDRYPTLTEMRKFLELGEHKDSRRVLSLLDLVELISGKQDLGG